MKLRCGDFLKWSHIGAEALKLEVSFRERCSVYTTHTVMLTKSHSNRLTLTLKLNILALELPVSRCHFT